MSKERADHQPGIPSIVVSEPQRALAELSAYYAQIPEDLLASGNPSAVVVYGILDRIAHEGEGWTSIEIIAKRAHLGTRTVQTARAWLVTNGWLIIVRQGRSGRASDYLLPWRSTRQHARPVSLTCNNGTLQDAELAQHPEPSPKPKIPEPSTTTSIQGFSENGVLEVWPDWYSTLWAIPGFKIPLPHARQWLAKQGHEGISEERANITAYSLKSKWPGDPKKPYTDPWATFQHWVKRPPLQPMVGRGARRVEPSNDLSRYTKF